MNCIKTLIVEDDSGWLYAVKDLLSKENDIIVVAEARNKEDAINAANNLDLDVIVMDINLNGNKCDGIYAAAEISQISKVKIVMLTSLNENDTIINSFTAGAVNFLSKEKCSRLADTIRSAKFDNSPYEVLLGEYSKLKQEEQIKDLSSSEKEIFYLYEKGYTRNQIQDMLYKSENTVKSQVRSILSKLGVSSLKQGIQKVKRKGVIENKKLWGNISKCIL